MQRIYDKLGDAFPVNTRFTPIGVAGGFQIIDSNGTIYGQTVADVDTASQIAGNLNELAVMTPIKNIVKNTLIFNPEDLNETDISKAKNAGARILDPDTSIFDRFEVDEFGNTTFFQKGYQPELTWEEALQQKKKLTKSQRLNQKRAEKNIPVSSSFTLKEVKSVLSPTQFDNLVNAHIQSVTNENYFFDDEYIQALVEQGNTLTKGKQLSKATKVTEAREELYKMEEAAIVKRITDPRQAGLKEPKKELIFERITDNEERIKRRMNKAQKGR